jgi:2-polyprenyl-3-methyl-5-hydroxy-6-metoxy-1,4-benzoquinol methylase
MHAILCPLCQADHTAPIRQRRYRGLLVTTVICRGCGLVYHNPVIDDLDRQDLNISSRQWHTDAVSNPRQDRKQERRWQLQWPLLEPAFQPGSRVLEIGGGLGGVGGRLKARGGEVWGVEPDPEQAAYARDRWGLTMWAARFEEVDFAGKQFDLILASHVIEHFPEPLAFLAKTRTLAAPEARLFLETPNILAPKVSFRRLFSLPHNFYLSPRTLSWLLSKSGWEVETLKVWRRDAFQVLARPAAARNPAVAPDSFPEVRQAIARHRYLYYAKLLFLWRKMPWWQKHWMYTQDPRFP